MSSKNKGYDFVKDLTIHDERKCKENIPSLVHVYGFDLSNTLVNDKTLLMICCEFNWISLMRLLFENYKVDVNKKNKLGRCALYIAARDSKPKTVEFLLQQPNIVIDTLDNLGHSPLAEAVHYLNIENVWLLLKYGAKVDYRISVLYKDGGFITATALYECCVVDDYDPKLERDDQLAMIRLLVENGANPNVQESSHGRTPLHEAAINGDSDIFQLLYYEYGACLNCKDFDGVTPLQILKKTKGDSAEIKGKKQHILSILSRTAARAA